MIRRYTRFEDARTHYDMAEPATESVDPIESEQLSREYVVEKVKLNYEQVKVLTAILVGVGIAAVTAIREIDFDSFTSSITINYWMGCVGLIISTILFILIRNKIIDSEELIELLK